jgi:general secretion pathway protein G
MEKFKRKFGKRFSQKSQIGFTLIELLVVIAIIGLLASVILVALNSARAKARDARKKADFKNIQTALFMYYDKLGSMPGNHGGGGCDNFAASMQDLVNEGLLSRVPQSPGGYQYCYLDYGSGGSIGALLVTRLEKEPFSTTGFPPSCRPWNAGVNNWCTQDSSDYYCLCNPY